MKLRVFADYICPFSYLALLNERGLGIEPERYAFELRPPGTPPLGAADDREWGLVTELSASAGMELARPSARPRTRKAHEAAKFAALTGRADAMHRAIFDAYFRYGRDIGRIDVLVEIGRDSGLDPLALKIALDVDSYTHEVVADEELAATLEITGTPTFVAGGEMLSGYIGAEQLKSWLNGNT